MVSKYLALLQNQLSPKDNFSAEAYMIELVLKLLSTGECPEFSHLKDLATAAGDTQAVEFFDGLLSYGTDIAQEISTDSFSDAITSFIEGPEDKTYVLDEKAAFAYTIDSLSAKLGAGTANLAIQINGVSVTGLSALAASTSQASASATAARSVAPGDRVTLVVSSTSGASDLALTLKYTR